jgi:hypothetical protein
MKVHTPGKIIEAFKMTESHNKYRAEVSKIFGPLLQIYAAEFLRKFLLTLKLRVVF